MAGNTFGSLFRITTFGESHGPAIGVVIDGCPSQLDFDMDLLNQELQRRKPGQSALTTARNEDEFPEILSGVFEGKTTGAPICILIKNKDQRPGDYDAMKDMLRPSHADFTYLAKYGHRDHRGSGRASARETAARVAAGAVAKMLLHKSGISIQAYVHQIGEIALSKNYTELDLSATEKSLVRCPDNTVSLQMEQLITEMKQAGDSVGGIIACVAKNVPAGLGEPVFDKLHAELGKAILSINACKGFEMGSGFYGATQKGSKQNDSWVNTGDKLTTYTNNSGGVQGGISNGADIFFKCAFKPVSTIAIAQQSLDVNGNPITLEAKGRHDPCVLPRAVPIVEAMCAMVLADMMLRHNAIK
jgi:chorismate synthase